MKLKIFAVLLATTWWSEGCGVTFKIVCVSSQKAGEGGRTMMKQRKKTCESKRPKGNKNVTEFQIEY